MHLIFLAEIIVISVIEHCGPVVVVGGQGLSQGDGNLGESKTVCQLFGHIFVTFVIYRASGNVGICGLDAKYVCCILLVGDADVHIFAQLAHYLAGFGLGPQLISVI